ncbi:MAG: NnrS family protein, partial [Thiotrichales bacterium]|nr:NnrS family protein [Thiotrichales bacterium]
MFFFDRAFRSFFIGGSLFSVVAMLVWLGQYPMASKQFSTIVPMMWHAHEMVFGYALATVTGFLLTAVMNWTRL